MIIISVREEDNIIWKDVAELRAVKAKNGKKKKNPKWIIYKLKIFFFRLIYQNQIEIPDPTKMSKNWKGLPSAYLA